MCRCVLSILLDLTVLNKLRGGFDRVETQSLSYTVRGSPSLPQCKYNHCPAAACHSSQCNPEARSNAHCGVLSSKSWQEQLATEIKEFARNMCRTGNIIVLGTVFLDKAKLKLSQAVFPFTKLGSLLV